MKHIFSVLLFGLLTVFSSPVHGLDMKSGSYQIIFSDINSGSGEQKSSSYTLDASLGQTAAEQFNSNGYIVRAGFQYIHILYPFAFSLSNTSVNFGTLLPGSAAQKSITLTVSNRGQGYEVFAYTDYPLRRFSLEEIPDTSCDDEESPCTELNAKQWASKSAYGFGYTLAGTDKPTDFVNETYYRPFAAKNQNEDPVVVAQSTKAVKGKETIMTFKINASPIQPAGTYQTVVNFIAVAKY